MAGSDGNSLTNYAKQATLRVVSGTETIVAVDFSKAKNALSEVMTSVVHEHQLRLVSRHRGKEAMLLVRREDLAEMLESFRFDPRLTVGDGEVTAELAELGVLGFGASVDEALEDLVCELRRYAQRFFERFSFYRATDRAGHGPWLLRFALTPSDRQLELLFEDSRREAEAASPGAATAAV